MERIRGARSQRKKGMNAMTHREVKDHSGLMLNQNVEQMTKCLAGNHDWFCPKCDKPQDVRCEICGSPFLVCSVCVMED